MCVRAWLADGGHDSNWHSSPNLCSHTLRWQGSFFPPLTSSCPFMLDVTYLLVPGPCLSQEQTTALSIPVFLPSFTTSSVCNPTWKVIMFEDPDKSSFPSVFLSRMSFSGLCQGHWCVLYWWARSHGWGIYTQVSLLFQTGSTCSLRFTVKDKRTRPRVLPLFF